MTVVLVLCLLFGLLALGVPVAFSMAFSGSVGLFLVGGAPTLMGILQTTPLSTVSSYELIAIPMFLLMAEFVLVSGIADDLFRAAAAWVGRVPGGLGMATGPVVGGMIYDGYATYSWLFVLSFGLGMGAFLIALTFKPVPKAQGTALAT